jgi:NAD(P)H-nitrite reductase large subunit
MKHSDHSQFHDGNITCSDVTVANSDLEKNYQRVHLSECIEQIQGKLKAWSPSYAFTKARFYKCVLEYEETFPVT